MQIFVYLLVPRHPLLREAHDATKNKTTLFSNHLSLSAHEHID